MCYMDVIIIYDGKHCSEGKRRALKMLQYAIDTDAIFNYVSVVIGSGWISITGEKR